jgi:hypothetical protein
MNIERRPEGGLGGGTIKKALAKLKDSNDWTSQHSQYMITRLACIRTSNFSLPCSNVQQLRSARYPIPDSGIVPGEIYVT